MTLTAYNFYRIAFTAWTHTHMYNHDECACVWGSDSSSEAGAAANVPRGIHETAATTPPGAEIMH